VDWLAAKLKDAGLAVETVWIPFADDPEYILSEMAAFRMMELESSFDRVITFRPPAHVVKHRCKVVWFIHHIRMFYDLWESPYRPFPDSAYLRSFINVLRTADTNGLREARHLFTNSKTVSDRLRRYNGLESEVLYPPIFGSERFFNEAWGSEIVCICRMERHKRQHLAVEAMRYTKTPVRLRLSGTGLDTEYVRKLAATVARHGLADKVTIDQRWISEGEKAALLSTALANIYIALDEDSYGYPTIEAAHASKATIGTTDAGGVTEFVVHEENGWILPPEPEALADAFDRMWSDRSLAKRLGEAAQRRIGELSIDWDHVIERLTS
jgi:glycosyltransferase involved in cell wall biosynthesis